MTQLFNRHGRRVASILQEANEIADLGRHFGGGLVEREVTYLVAHEWAVEPDDILWRRTKCGLHMSQQQRDEFSAWFTEHVHHARLPVEKVA